MSRLDDAHRLAAKALASGGERKRVASVEWDIAGNCSSPVPREIWARPEIKNHKDVIVVPGVTPSSLGVDLMVRCRKCDNCLAVRRRLWAGRAKTELSQAVRSWLCTLTLTPGRQDYALNKARQKCSARGLDFDALSYKEQFIERHKVFSPWITLYLKRVRKVSGARLRYLLVAESHKSGLPHYHMLLHEQDVNSPVKYAVLQGQWPHGFSNHKLITDSAQATYVCKYLSKSAAARVRASLRYGRNEVPTGTLLRDREVQPNVKHLTTQTPGYGVLNNE